MTVKTREDREFLRSVFLATGDADVLDMLERGSARRRAGAMAAAFKARLIGAVPAAIVLAVIFFHN